ncbi:MAG: thiamine phosphate synthase [Rhizobiales bacterium]|nr:thiamine phosphate synthase [Hyphomicrobiales bacterium]
MNLVDLRLYAIVDPERTAGKTLADLARQVAEGGATLAQLRDKLSDTRPFIEHAKAVQAALAPHRVPLLINDRVDVALAIGADGVHVGQTDMEAADARRLLGPKAIIGLSLKSMADIEAAPIELLDYVAIGGAYTTTSKETKTPPVGLDGFKTRVAAMRARAPGMPIVAIAGIDASNAAGVIDAGTDGVSVISALSKPADSVAAARELRDVVDAALAKRGRA